MKASPPTDALFLCDGAPVPERFGHVPPDRIEPLTTVSEDGTSNLRLDSLVSRFGTSVPPMAEDLVLIASYCVAADQLIGRGTNAKDIHRAKWRRDLMLSIPVSNPVRWNQPSVTRALEAALAFATDDAWSFSFVQRPPASSVQLRITNLDDRQVMGNPNCVVLFSGGTDSLCALVDAFGNHGLHPVAVRHRAASQIHKWQMDLMHGVRRAFPSWTFPHLSFTMHRRGTGDSDPAQRTRPFLFAALGTAIAASLGIDRVFLPDNGYVSVNPQISSELAGALASRGTHPTLLRLLTELNEILFEAPIVIENPLAHRTRAEALKVLRELDCPHLLKQTHTCGNHCGRPRDQPHCGYCSQCVDRRFASLAASLAEFDPVESYGLDIFTAALPDGEARKIPLLYRQFARETQILSDDDMVARHPELLGCIDPDNPLALTQVIDVLRRHAHEVLAVMEDQVVVHRRALAWGDLPATCLLHLGGQSNEAVDTEQSEELIDVGTTNLDANLIELTPHICRLTFQGEKAEVPPLKGVKQLVRLLTAPHQDLSAMDLAYQTSPPSRSARAQLSEEGLHDVPSVEEMIDYQARDEYEKRARAIKDQLDAGVTDIVRQTLRSELEFIEAELTSAAGLAGRIRPMTNAQENARTLVHKNLKRALTDIEEVLPPLHAHLHASLHLGHVCSYTPRPSITWKIAS